MHRKPSLGLQGLKLPILKVADLQGPYGPYGPLLRVRKQSPDQQKLVSSCYTQLHMVSLILWGNFDGFQVSLVFVNHVPTWMVEIETQFLINDLNGSKKSINTHLLSLAKPTLI
ncbi:hypothetical protein HanRHA438_Chr04g0173511 [Helianthus annuus]|nr:hypothetical protein HanRHA438_Chr04g0173511 [Helianthus annuus]